MKRIRTNLLWTQALPLLLISTALMIIGFFIHIILGLLFAGFILFAFYFFRNPERLYTYVDDHDNVLLCPADGRVVDIQYEEGMFEGMDQKVSIFLSPMDVHVNWIPINGRVQKINYRPGKFIPAYVPKSSIYNERCEIILVDNSDRTIIVRQIAGKVARRIVWWIKEGDAVVQGQKYGMIKFGSRVDILLPKTVKIELTLGQRVYGGKTVLGRWLC